MSPFDSEMDASSLPPPNVEPQTFALDPLLREKNPDLHRRLPRWAITLFESVLRCHTINRELYANRAVPCREFPDGALAHLGVTYRARGPSTAAPRRPIYMANHPTGGLDGLIMLSWMLSRHDTVKVPANDILLDFPHLQPFMVPIDKYRRQRDIASVLHATFRSDAAVVVFPAGQTSRPIRGRLRDSPWQKMPIRMARLHHRPLVPVHISARNSRFFYALFNARRLLGIRTNLEIFLLARELLKPTTREVTVHIGRSVESEQLEALGRDDQQRIDALYAACYRLAEGPETRAEPEPQPQTG